MRLPNESPGQTPVPRERGLYSVSHGALLVAASAAVVALVAVYGWLMVLVAGHTGGVTAGLLLVFMGLSVILRDQNRNVFISTAQCLLLCGLFFGACFACRHLGDNEYLTPALAAWLPVLVFGPLAFVLFDAIHT